MRGRLLARAIGQLLSPPGKRGRLAVFCYHQVLEIPDPNRPGEPTPEQFADDIELIAGVFSVLSFGEAVSRLETGSLPPRAACITFDDGYTNNHSLAAPILERYGVPATFFIAGGAVDAGVMWNDLAIEAIAAGGGWPKIPAIGDFLEPPESSISAGHVTEHLLQQLKYRPMAERLRVAQALYRENVGDSLPRLMMDRTLVRDLAERGFEIGGHTINHPSLTELPDEDANAEIVGCYDWVRDVTGAAPISFAYPNGQTGIDYDERHAEMVRAAGFSAAASTDWGLATSTSDPVKLPRTGPWWRHGRQLETGLLRGYLRSYI